MSQQPFPPNDQIKYFHKLCIGIFPQEDSVTSRCLIRECFLYTLQMTLLDNPSCAIHLHKHMVSVYGIHKETTAPVGPASVGQTGKVNHSCYSLPGSML